MHARRPPMPNARLCTVGHFAADFHRIAQGPPGQSRELKKARGRCPIGVKLSLHGVLDVWSSLSSGVGEAAMHVWVGVQQGLEGERADDGDKQPPPGDVLHPPERGDVGGAE